jgi:plasmid stability protein
MAAILLKNIPEALRLRLQQRAKQNRRSMNQEALVILEQALPEPVDVKAIRDFKPIKLKYPIDVVEEIRKGRQERDMRYEELWGAMKAPLAAEGMPVQKTRRRRAR